MPWGLKRFQEAHCQHFITFSCYRRQQNFGDPCARDWFEQTLERVRRWYGVRIYAYVVMPEHIHLLINEPERAPVSVAIQMLKQLVSQKLRRPGQKRFWQVRYYDLPVWSEAKSIDKVKYIHRNPVKRGLVARPENWKWSSFNHYATGVEGVVEIESQWTATRRERAGQPLRLRQREELPHPPPKPGGRMGQP